MQHFEESDDEHREEPPRDPKHPGRRSLDLQAYALLSVSPAYFISSTRLGMIEGNLMRMIKASVKRYRAIELNRIQNVLKTLQIIPAECKVTGLALGCLDTGEAGAFIFTTSSIKVVGPTLPEAS